MIDNSVSSIPAIKQYYPFPNNIISLQNIITNYFKSAQALQKLQARQYYLNDQAILYNRLFAQNELGEFEEAFAENNKVIDNELQRMVNQKTAHLASNTMTVLKDSYKVASNSVEKLSVILKEYLQSDIREIVREAILFQESYYDCSRRKILVSEHVIPLKGSFESPDDEGVISIEPHTFFDNNSDILLYYDITVYKFAPTDIQAPLSYHTVPQKIRMDYDISPFTGKYKELVEGTIQNLPPKGKLIKFQSTNSLFVKLKGLQDALNRMLSTLINNILEDKRSTIYVIENYSGQNLGEFRRNVLTHGVIPIQTVEGIKGDVKTLKIEVNTENLKVCINEVKKAIIRNAGGYDMEDLKSGVTPNQMTIKAIFNEISLDSDDIEILFEKPLRKLVAFVMSMDENAPELPTIKFNRSNVVIESQQIIDAINLKGFLPRLSIIKRLPKVINPEEEYEALLKEEGAEAKKEEEVSQPVITGTRKNSSEPSKTSKPSNQAEVFNNSENLLH